MNASTVSDGAPEGVSMLPQSVASPAPRYVRHKKRGTTYRVIGVGRMQAEDWVHKGRAVDGALDGWVYESVDMGEVVAYQCLEDGALWVRPVAEFENGRFEDVPVPAQPVERGWIALADFARWAIQEGVFTGGACLHGCEIQDKAVELGLLRDTAYDPEKHGVTDYGVVPGDSWLEFAGPLLPSVEDGDGGRGLKDGLPPRAAQGAADICHDEQMAAWTDEVASHLSAAGVLKEDGWGYEDALTLHRVLAEEIRRIVGAVLEGTANG